MSLNWNVVPIDYATKERQKRLEDRQITIATIVLCGCFWMALVSAFVWLGDYVATCIDHLGRMPQ